MNYEFLTDYKDQDPYRKSFNTLAELVFGIDFESWYQKGYWQEQYNPHTLFDGGRAVANVSVNLMDLVLQGNAVKAIQLGTVMTHPDYRKKGLSAWLMEKVLSKYEPEYEFIYLFANSSVLDFYPKFGFERVRESQFSIDTRGVKKATDIRKLDLSSPADQEKLRKASAQRVPVSQTLAAVADQSLLMFYCESYLKDQLYYVPSEDAVVILELDGNSVRIVDVLCNHPFSLQNIVDYLPAQEKHEVFFGFTPDGNQNYKTASIESDDYLFMKPVPAKLNNKKFMFPLLSHA